MTLLYIYTLNISSLTR